MAGRNEEWVRRISVWPLEIQFSQRVYGVVLGENFFCLLINSARKASAGSGDVFVGAAYGSYIHRRLEIFFPQRAVHKTPFAER